VSRSNGIPFERLIEATRPNRLGIPKSIMEQVMAVRKQVALSVVYPNAAGIDIGAHSHFVAVPPERCADSVREFASFTESLEQLAQWLQACAVDTVVMESTGVYWIPVYELLESRGFTVFLVNARHVKNVSGKKSDVLDCQWLQQLMSFGLLAGAFRPDAQVCALREMSRLREITIDERARHTQRMQKALTQMNVQLANVITDIMGETGQKIIRAIVAGERDAMQLAKLRNYRIHASESEIAASLRGTWREEHLFCLTQALQLFDTYQQLIAQADGCIAAQLARFQRTADKPPPAKNKGRAKNAPRFDVRSALFGWAQVDLTRIDGIDVGTALVILAELGADLSKFKSVKHFASWLGLCPGTRISGGKRLSRASKRIANPVTRALKLAAQGLSRSHCALGAYYRRMAARLGAGKAITATAHKLARYVYAILTRGEAFVERSEHHYEQQFKDRTLRYLQRKAATLGFTLSPVCATSA
jgi:transposase